VANQQQQAQAAAGQTATGPFIVQGGGTTSLSPFVDPNNVPPELMGAATTPYQLLIIKGWLFLGGGIIAHITEFFTSVIALENLGERYAVLPFMNVHTMTTEAALLAQGQALAQIRPWLFLIAIIPSFAAQSAVLMSAIKQSQTWQRLLARQNIAATAKEVASTINAATLFKIFGFVCDVISDGTFARLYTTSPVLIGLWMAGLISMTLILVPQGAQMLSDGYYEKGNADDDRAARRAALAQQYAQNAQANATI
jgi:hypothetical protein